MKTATLFMAWAATAMFQTVFAHPAMAKTLKEVRKRADSDQKSTELIGDLITLSDSQLTSTAKTIKGIITSDTDPQSTEKWTYTVPTKGTTACAKDTCCIWQYIANDMQAMFKGSSGRCNSYARAAVRLGFHDCAGWAKSTGLKTGGCDGSLVLAPAEILRTDNNGLQTIVAQMKVWYSTYKSYGVSMADLVQMGATVATVVCPLGPRIHSYVGRKDSTIAAPTGLLPGVNQDADTLIKLFQDKTISPYGLTALIGAHTTSQQRFVNTSRAGDPQDSTPGVWDVKFYNETLSSSAPKRVFKFASDVALAKDSRIASEFQEFASSGGQDDWNEDYAREYVRLSLLGVYNINNLTDCSKVLPARVTSFTAADQAYVTKWLNTTTHSDAIMNALLNGSLISSLLALLKTLFGSLFS